MPWTTWLGVAVCVVFSAGASLALDALTATTVTEVLLWLGPVASALGVVVGVRQLRDPKPALVLDSHGVEGAFGRVAWGNVLAISIGPKGGFDLPLGKAGRRSSRPSIASCSEHRKVGNGHRLSDERHGQRTPPTTLAETGGRRARPSRGLLRSDLNRRDCKACIPARGPTRCVAGPSLSAPSSSDNRDALIARPMSIAAGARLLPTSGSGAAVENFSRFRAADTRRGRLRLGRDLA
jgi:hypothetical protein